MSVFMPTLIPRPQTFPLLLPKPPQPHPVPTPKRVRAYGHLNAVRDLQREMDDLSDEESELEDINLSIHKRGFSFLIPIGRSLTQLEEKNDADDTEDSGSDQSGDPPSPLEDDEENESAPDLDASMEDLDGDMTAETEDNEDMAEGNTEEFEEETSEL